MIRVPHRNDARHWAYLSLVVMLIRTFFRLIYRIEVHPSRAQLRGPCLFVGNHRSFMDPPGVSCWLDRPVAFFARASLWKIPIIRTALNLFGGFPINRSEPQMQIMRRVVAHLKSGESLVMFPEGTRTKTGRMGEIRDGAALFARRAGVPIVPVYLQYSEYCWPRGMPFPVPGAKLRVYYGEPIHVPSDLPRRDQDAYISSRMRGWLQEKENQLLGMQRD
ncbi:MAG: 1-acyl-sn-glycerol-3-phosphate acyltransferase [Sphaerospermopsis sp. SIO1G2]|nr:1-acyl-sn-glycerol-3-phosphate acyltransferase [Sphaerospermopsis sp. SIO1G2]